MKFDKMACEDLLAFVKETSSHANETSSHASYQDKSHICFI